MHQVDVITSKRIADYMHFALHHTPDVTDEVRHRGTRARDIHPTVARAMRHIRGLRLPRLGLHSVVLRMLWLRLHKPGENCAARAGPTPRLSVLCLCCRWSCPATWERSGLHHWSKVYLDSSTTSAPLPWTSTALHGGKLSDA